MPVESMYAQGKTVAADDKMASKGDEQKTAQVPMPSLPLDDLSMKKPATSCCMVISPTDSLASTQHGCTTS